MNKGFTRCESPLCGKIIYADGYLYGKGKFCDKICRDDYDSINFRMNDGKRKERVANARKAVRIRHRETRKMYKNDDYQFTFNPKVV